ncbi:lytic transglycosylase domain-containing protein, partial [Legionella pneumophila]
GPTNVRRLLAKNVKPVEYNSRVMKNYSVLYSNITSKKPHTVAAL